MSDLRPLPPDAKIIPREDVAGHTPSFLEVEPSTSKYSGTINFEPLNPLPPAEVPSQYDEFLFPAELENLLLAEGGPDEVTKLKISNEFGRMNDLSPEFVYKNFDALMNEFYGTTDVNTALRYTTARRITGQLAHQMGQVGFAWMTGQKTAEEAIDEITALEAQLPDLATMRASVGEKIWGAILEQLPSLARTMGAAAVGGATGAAVGAAFGAIAGPGAIATAISFGAKGAIAAGSAASGVLEMSSLVASLLVAKDPDTGEGIDPNLIRAAGIGIFQLAAVTEAIPFSGLIGNITGVKTLGTKIASKVIRRIAAGNTIARVAARGAGRLGTQIGLGVLQETFQEGMSATLAEIVKAKEGMPSQDFEEFLYSWKELAFTTAILEGVLNIPGISISLIRERPSAQRLLRQEVANIVRSNPAETRVESIVEQLRGNTALLSLANDELDVLVNHYVAKDLSGDFGAPYDFQIPRGIEKDINERIAETMQLIDDERSARSGTGMSSVESALAADISRLQELAPFIDPSAATPESRTSMSTREYLDLTQDIRTRWEETDSRIAKHKADISTMRTIIENSNQTQSSEARAAAAAELDALEDLLYVEAMRSAVAGYAITGDTGEATLNPNFVFTLAEVLGGSSESSQFSFTPIDLVDETAEPFQFGAIEEEKETNIYSASDAMDLLSGTSTTAESASSPALGLGSSGSFLERASQVGISNGDYLVVNRPFHGWYLIWDPQNETPTAVEKRGGGLNREPGGDLGDASPRAMLFRHRADLQRLLDAMDTDWGLTTPNIQGDLKDIKVYLANTMADGTPVFTEPTDVDYLMHGIQQEMWDTVGPDFLEALSPEKLGEYRSLVPLVVEELLGSFNQNDVVYRQNQEAIDSMFDGAAAARRYNLSLNQLHRSAGIGDAERATQIDVASAEAPNVPIDSSTPVEPITKIGVTGPVSEFFMEGKGIVSQDQQRSDAYTAYLEETEALARTGVDVDPLPPTFWLHRYDTLRTISRNDVRAQFLPVHPDTVAQWISLLEDQALSLPEGSLFGSRLDASLARMRKAADEYQAFYSDHITIGDVAKTSDTEIRTIDIAIESHREELSNAKKAAEQSEIRDRISALERKKEDLMAGRRDVVQLSEVARRRVYRDAQHKLSSIESIKRLGDIATKIGEVDNFFGYLTGEENLLEAMAGEDKDPKVALKGLLNEAKALGAEEHGLRQNRGNVLGGIENAPRRRILEDMKAILSKVDANIAKPFADQIRIIQRMMRLSDETVEISEVHSMLEKILAEEGVGAMTLEELEAFFKRGIDQWTVEELARFRTKVEFLRYAGKQQLRELQFSQALTVKRYTDAIQDNLLKGSREEFEAMVSKSPEMKAFAAKNPGKSIRSLAAAFMTPDVLADLLDGHQGFKGEAYNLFITQRSNGLSSKISMIDEIRSNMSKSLKDANLPEDWTSVEITLEGRQYSTAEVLGIYLAAKDNVTLEAMQELNGVGQSTIDAVNIAVEERADLSHAVFAFKTAIADLWEKSRKTMIELGNVDLGFSETPFPMFAEQLNETFQEARENRTSRKTSTRPVSEIFNSEIRSRYMDKKANEKTFAVSGRPIGPMNLDMSEVFLDLLEKTAHLTQMGQVLTTQRAVLNETRVKDAIISRLGKGVFENMSGYVQANSHPDSVYAHDAVSKSIRWLRRGGSIAAVAGRPISAVRQVWSLVNYLFTAGPAHFMKGLAMTYVHPLKSWDWVSQDTVMKNRSRTIEEADFAKMARSFGKYHKDVIKAAFFFSRMVDRFAVTAGYQAMYSREISNGRTPTLAREVARDHTLRTQPHGDLTILPGIYRQGEFVRVALMFSQQMIKNFGLMTYDLVTTDTEHTVPQHVARKMLLAFGLTSQAAVIWTLKNGRPPESEEDWADAVAYSMLSYIPIAGRELSSVFTGAYTGSSIVIDGLTGPAKIAVKLAKGEFDESLLKTGLKTFGFWLHLPGQLAVDVMETIDSGNPLRLFMGLSEEEVVERPTWYR